MPDEEKFGDQRDYPGMTGLPAKGGLEVDPQESEEPPKKYPYQDGDVLVLGPEVFISADRRVISYAGQNYVVVDEDVPKPLPPDLRDEVAPPRWP